MFVNHRRRVPARGSRTDESRSPSGPGHDHHSLTGDQVSPGDPARSPHRMAVGGVRDHPDYRFKAA
ncbi:hypothetical protein Asi03nite_03660 [Actinoplanes siamensis]|uniref:Uncharacterized protein n=1 Tax=Actinoplanes siamensis TaxID=1223317 RepID=A0A919KB10_9ACTN|nr:hypothetical protein Asi03nite_03660 [Actinoplanes siamensis]